MIEFASDDQSPDARIARTHNLILAVGYDLKVHPAKGKRPGYAHTVGLTRYGHRELIVFGLPPDIARRLLRDLCRRTQRGPLEAGFYEDVLHGRPTALIDVDKGRAAGFIRLPTTMFTQDLLIGALQIVWPDQASRFPWQHGYDLDPWPQPLLGFPPPTEPPTMICGGVIND